MAQQAKSKGSARQERSKVPRRDSGGISSSGRRAWIVAALLVFAAATLVTYVQPMWPDPYRPPELLSLDWWMYPHERNAFKRLPVITGLLNDIFALDEKQVWAVGQEGLLVRTKDGGETWSGTRILLRRIEPKAGALQSHGKNLESGYADQREKAADSPHEEAVVSEAHVLKLHPPFGPDEEARDGRRTTGGRVGVLATMQEGGFGECMRECISPNPSFQSGVTERICLAECWMKYGNTGLREYFRDGSLYQLEQVDEGKAARRSADLVDFFGAQIYFENQNQGVIVASPSAHSAGSRRSLLLWTQDGGQTWQMAHENLLPPTSLLSGLFEKVKRTRAGRSNQPAYTRGTSNVDDERACVWGIGQLGEILRSDDGGRVWRRCTREWLADGSFPSQTQGWAVGYSGSVFCSTDGGATWTTVKPVEIGLPTERKTPFVVPRIFALDASNIWICDATGYMQRSRDGGQTWQQLTSPISTQISISSHAAPGLSIMQEAIVFHFANENLGWYGESPIFVSTNGGTSWREWSIPEYGRVQRTIFHADRKHGWAWTYGSKLLVTSDGGTSYTALANVPKTQNLSHLFFLDSQTGWAISANHQIYHTSDGGASPWRTLVRAPSSGMMPRLHFATVSNGWARFLPPEVIQTRDGGKSWQQCAEGFQGLTLSMMNTASDDCRAFGSYGMLCSTDGGETWVDPTLPHRRFPAPWYYVALVGSLLLILPAYRRPKAQEEPKRSVADLLVSDRPIEAGDYDPLGFDVVAEGLSRFLRNESTQPPLTIAITGEWGTGKSSLMNLVEADLKRYGYRPVLFNAWHHQQEDHLLASLLENIRVQAIPPWWTLEGTEFRCRLLRRRGKRKWMWVLALVVLLVGVFGYFTARPALINSIPTDLDGAIAWILRDGQPPPGEAAGQGAEARQEAEAGTTGPGEAAVGENAERPAPTPAPDPPPAAVEAKPAGEKPASRVERGSSLAILLAGLASAFLMLRRGLSAFGVKPAELMASVAGKHPKDLQAKTSFRHRFQREFEDVTESLKPLTMVILIDDLDRCSPQNVLNVLESVNFLVTCGDCYIVMGMALDRVERCVGYGFGDLATEVLDDEDMKDGETPEEATRRRRARFARQYLEKLVNIEVPVPRPTADQTLELVNPAAYRRAKPSNWERCKRGVVRTAAMAWFPMAVSAALVGGYMWGASGEEQPAVVSAAAAPEDATKIGSPSTPGGVDDPGASGLGDEEGPRAVPNRFIPAAPGGSAWGHWVTPLAALLAVGLAAVVLRRPGRVVRDSDDFKDALRVWHPIVVARRHTPRAVKRFLNRVRFYAMRQARPEAERPLAVRVWKSLPSGVQRAGEKLWTVMCRIFVRKKQESGPEVASEAGSGGAKGTVVTGDSAKPLPHLSEPMLVALGAIRHFGPHWITENDHWTAIRSHDRELKEYAIKTWSLKEDDAQTREAALLQSAIAEHRKAFKSWSPTDDHRKALTEIFDNIQVR